MSFKKERKKTRFLHRKFTVIFKSEIVLLPMYKNICTKIFVKSLKRNGTIKVLIDKFHEMNAIFLFNLFKCMYQ